MSDYNKPIIVISKCLGFDNCKHDGSIENNEFIEKLKKYVKVIPICPEIECGLQIHHSKLRIVENNNKGAAGRREQIGLTLMAMLYC